MNTDGGESLHINRHILTQDNGFEKKTIKLEIPEANEWGVIDLKVRAFEKYYARGMADFKRDLDAKRREYNLATEGDLKKSGFRNTVALPIMRDPVSGDDDSLLQALERVFPDLFKTKSKHYMEFIRRYPEFVVPEKI